MKRFLITAVGLAVILILTLLIFRIPVGEGLNLLYRGAFGDRFGWSRTAVKATPLLFTGLAMVVAWRAGAYNIGGEGQFIVGGLFGATLARILHLPGPMETVAILLACIGGGAFWAWLAAWLRVRRGVDVVIGTILLNFIALQILGWAVSGPLQEARAQLPLTDLLPDSAMLPRFNRQMDVHAGLILALLAAIGVYLYLFRSKAGFLARVSGDNPRVARANRIDAPRAQLQAMAISGALCGLAGGVEYTGIAGQLGTSFSQNWGFLGIPVALLGALHPAGACASAATFGALFAGSENLARFNPAGTTLIYVMQGAAVLGYVALQSQRKPAKGAA